MPERAVRVDLPGELDPELRSPPRPRRVGLVGVGETFLPSRSIATRRTGWRKAIHCPACVSWLIRSWRSRAVAHRQDVVGPPRGLAPGRRQRDVQPDLRLVPQDLEPGEAVGVRPHRVVDAGEVDVELAAPLLEEVRQQEAHLEVATSGYSRGQVQLVPALRRAGGRCGAARDPLVPGVGGRAALAADRARQDVQQEEAARDLPAAEVSRAGARQLCAASRPPQPADVLGDTLDRRAPRLPTPGAANSKVKSRVRSSRRRLEGLEASTRPSPGRESECAGTPPSSPSADELAVVAVRRDAGGCAIASRIAASEPGHGEIHVSAIEAVLERRVSQTISFAPGRLALDDPLGVRVEVVARSRGGC